MVVTMPSPTRAMIVSSVAPPTKRSRLVRTVTRALALTLDAVLGHAVDGGLAGRGIRAVDDLGIDAGLHGLEHGLAGALGGEVDGAGAVEVEVNAGLVRGDERLHDHVRRCRRRGSAPREIVDGEVDAGFHGGDAVVHDQARPARAAGAGRSARRTSPWRPK